MTINGNGAHSLSVETVFVWATRVALLLFAYLATTSLGQLRTLQSSHTALVGRVVALEVQRQDMTRRLDTIETKLDDLRDIIVSGQMRVSAGGGAP